MLTLAPTPTVLQSPLNWHHPRARGLVGRWCVLPGLGGAGSRWADLTQGMVGVVTGAAVPPTAASGWGATTRPGGWGELVCDGTDDHVEVGTPGVLDLQGPLTLAAWVKLAAWVSNTDGNYIVGKGYDSGTDTEQYWLRIQNNGGGANASGNDLTAGTYNGGGTSVSVAFTLTSWLLATWHHVAMTFDGATWSLYDNGRPVTSTASGVTPWVSPAPITIGALWEAITYARFLNAALDDICFWNRGLSAVELLEHYGEGQRGDPGMLRSLGHLPWRAMGS